ncbi:MAG: hypothetical protein KY453_10065, partial [Gemmatimonadetes bacterium]|nr:hypothetical protein [Gemmatimonadota bacterium]
HPLALPEASMSPPPTALRLTFRYEGIDVRLEHVASVTVTLPPSAPDLQGPQRGSWLELRGPGDEVLYRQLLPHLFGETAEVSTDDVRRPVAQARVPTRSGVFSVLVPGNPDARRVALFAAGTDREDAGLLGTFALEDAPRGPREMPS